MEIKTEARSQKSRGGGEDAERKVWREGAWIKNTVRESRFALQERTSCIPKRVAVWVLRARKAQAGHLPRAGESNGYAPEEHGNQSAQLCGKEKRDRDLSSPGKRLV